MATYTWRGGHGTGTDPNDAAMAANWITASGNPPAPGAGSVNIVPGGLTLDVLAGSVLTGDTITAGAGGTLSIATSFVSGGSLTGGSGNVSVDAFILGRTPGGSITLTTAPLTAGLSVVPGLLMNSKAVLGIDENVAVAGTVNASFGNDSAMLESNGTLTLAAARRRWRAPLGSLAARRPIFLPPCLPRRRSLLPPPVTAS